MKPVYLIYFVVFSVLAACSGQKQPKEVIKETKVIEGSHFNMPEIPETMSFCGEKINLRYFDAQERIDKELLVNTFYHSNTIQYFKRAHRFFPLIERILEEENVPSDMKYLCLIESGLTQAVSPSGASGFWQFMPSAGKEYGLTINKEIDERYHIEKSTRAACAYLKDAHGKFDDWSLTAAAYNRGMGGIESDLEKQQVEEYLDLHLNNETSRYMFRILALKLIFESPNDYGFYPDEMYLYEPIDVRKVEVKESITNLTSWAVENGSNYHQLKTLNPWILGNSLTVNNTTFTIELPKE